MSLPKFIFWLIGASILSFFVSPSPAEGQSLLVYENTFDASALEDFNVSTTLTGGNTEDSRGYDGNFGFSGDFRRVTQGANGSGNNGVLVTISNLPRFSSVDVDFLLAIIDSWDGSSSQWGPDEINLEVRDGMGNVLVNLSGLQDGSGPNPTTPFDSGTILFTDIQYGFNTGGQVWFRDDGYDLGLQPELNGIDYAGDTLVFEIWASGNGFQGGNDESFAIEDLQLSLNNVYAWDNSSDGSGTSRNTRWAGGNNNRQNWVGDGNPQDGAHILFFDDVVGAADVDLRTSPEVTSLNFDHTDAYTITPQNASRVIIFQDNAEQNAITVRSTNGPGSGDHTIAADMQINDDLLIEVDSATQGLALTGQTTGTGDITISGIGTVNLNRGGGDALIHTGDVIIEGGTLLLGASNQIADSVDLTLDGGSLGTGGFSDVLGSLTLSSSSTLDLGAGSSTLTFADGSYSAGTLTIDNWSGELTGGGTDQIIFSSSLSSSFLDSVFWSDLGISGARQLASGEIVPIPEASTLLAGFALVGLALWQWRRAARLKGDS